MRLYAEAYDKDGKQVLGNLDGQAVFHTINYRRTRAFIRLRDLPAEKLSLAGRVTEYRIVSESGSVMEVIKKSTPAILSR